MILTYHDYAMEENRNYVPEGAVAPQDTAQHGGTTHLAHGECCEECKRTCKRNFWTEVLRTAVKIATLILAAFGLSSFISQD